MRAWILLPIVWLQGIASCGSRTELGGVVVVQDSSVDAQPISPCQAGDSPRTLVTGIQAYQFNGMATDGERLYVAQSVAPLLWSVPMLGGATVALYGNDFQGSISASIPTPLLAADGGVYFDAIGDTAEALTWVNGAGGTTKTIAPNYVAFFDWTQPRGFAWSGDDISGTFSTVAFDGTVQPYLTIDPLLQSSEIAAVLATRRFIHVALIDLSSNPLPYSDRRFDLATGTFHDEIALDAANTQIFMGPTAICVLSTNADGISCLADDQSAVVHIPTSDGPFPRYIDDQWVYAAVENGATSDFARFSLIDGHEQMLMAGAFPSAVTSFGDCVYAALTETASEPFTTNIWRISPAL